MAIFGLGDDKPKQAKKVTKKVDSQKASAAKSASKSAVRSSSQEDEAKALLEQMQAKSDAGNCPFC